MGKANNMGKDYTTLYYMRRNYTRRKYTEKRLHGEELHYTK